MTGTNTILKPVFSVHEKMGFNLSAFPRHPARDTESSRHNKSQMDSKFYPFGSRFPENIDSIQLLGYNQTEKIRKRDTDDGVPK